ncbi:MAG: ptp [Bacteroidota bacterium]|jgi:hypothetical protein|nr:ptp [Bacteroidota bacterium]
MLKAKNHVFFFFILLNYLGHSQSFKEKIAALPGITFSSILNENSSERYEVFVEQDLDHNNSSAGKFKQRIVIDFKSLDSNVVMDTDGYAINYAVAPMHQHELATLVNANLIIIEHRFFGRSVPDKVDYKYLTTSQAAADVHYIKTLFSSIFYKNKWISTGISKGGQAALAHKINYPDDVALTIVYGTAIKKNLNENKIDSMLTALSNTECGKKLSLFQNNLFLNKASLLPQLNDFVFKNGISFGDLDTETVLDYMILELPFSFWQSGGDCSKIPLTTEDPFEMMKFLSSVITPSFYSVKTLKRLEPSFYMSYHELGFYEYDIKKFKNHLKQKNYSNKRFAPSGINIPFDKTYLRKLSEFLKSPTAEKVLFIYGENDPWSAMQSTGKSKKIIIKYGSHKSRIRNMSEQQKVELEKFVKRNL